MLSLSIDVGVGDFTYNIRRKMFALIPLKEEIAYHLFSFEDCKSDPFNLIRRTKWDPKTPGCKFYEVLRAKSS